MNQINRHNHHKKLVLVIVKKIDLQNQLLINRQPQPQVLKKLQISDGRAYENKRLRELNMIRSPTQMNTPGVGNCFIEAVADQTRYDINYKL